MKHILFAISELKGKKKELTWDSENCCHKRVTANLMVLRSVSLLRTGSRLSTIVTHKAGAAPSGCCVFRATQLRFKVRPLHTALYYLAKKCCIAVFGVVVVRCKDVTSTFVYRLPSMLSSRRRDGAWVSASKEKIFPRSPSHRWLLKETCVQQLVYD